MRDSGALLRRERPSLSAASSLSRGKQRVLLALNSEEHNSRYG